MNWAIGDKAKTRISGVCKIAFCNVYCVSPSHVDTIMKEIKDGVHSTSSNISDRSRIDAVFLKNLRKISEKHGFHLSHRQVAAAKLPNSPSVLTAYAWMARHFDLIGCTVPNMDGEIHLEPIVPCIRHRRYTIYTYPCRSIIAVT